MNEKSTQLFSRNRLNSVLHSRSDIIQPLSICNESFLLFQAQHTYDIKQPVRLLPFTRKDRQFFLCEIKIIKTQAQLACAENDLAEFLLCQFPVERFFSCHSESFLKFTASFSHSFIPDRFLAGKDINNG